MTYALSTEEVRDLYVLAADTTNADRGNGEDFDHWLAAFKRDTEIALLERLADEYAAIPPQGESTLSRWLRAKANELRKEQP
jgi:hypothetical protein